MSAATLLLSLVLICRTLQLHAMGIAVLSVLVVVSAPMMLTLMTGQIGLILLLPFTLAWHCARQGRYARAGAWIGVSASIKPFFLLFVVYFVLLRRLRAAQMACLTLLGMFATGLTLFGLEAHRAWINHLSSVSWAEHYVNASVLGFVERTFSISEWQQVPIVNWPQVVRPVWLLAGGGICVATLWRVRHVADLDRQFLLTATASLLVSPVGWVYYAWFLMPPLAAGLTSRENPMPAWRVGLFGLGIASLLVPPPVPSMAVQWGHGLWTATLGSVYFWGLFALWIVAWIQLPQASVTLRSR